LRRVIIAAYQRIEPIESDTEFPIECTGDVVTGDHIRFTEAVFGGSFRKPRFEGIRTVDALVVNDSYGIHKQQHTFTLEVTRSQGHQALAVGATTTRKGRNIYRNGTVRKLWADDESDRDAEVGNKHERGTIARVAREERVGW
jgi:hypothetical protein